MQTAIVVQGRLVGPTTIELNEPLSQPMGAVEVVVRSQPPADGAKDTLLEFINKLPPGMRSKESIDAQIEEERNSWER